MDIVLWFSFMRDYLPKLNQKRSRRFSSLLHLLQFWLYTSYLRLKTILDVFFFFFDLLVVAKNYMTSRFYIRYLKIKVFGHCPGGNGERHELTWPVPCRQNLGLRFTSVQHEHALEVSDLLQGFLHPKTSQSRVWEEILLFGTLSLINHPIRFHRNVFLKTISELK